jgi:FKBP-type peptidyl-prolyl cis-trans isomerase FkpA
MFKTIKTVVVLLSLLLLIFISSCNISGNVTERSAAIEEKELDEAITKLENKGYDIDTTKLGVYYIVNKLGTGSLPQKNDTCFLIYTGYFLDGTIFDTSANYYQDSIWKFNYMEESLIPGFYEGISILNKGAEADIIIPSILAYGAYGNSGIPPYTPLLFTLKMKDLRPRL